jgi:hypothetical protein
VFPELRRFKQGRRFKQWTGDDSKALMKVCIVIFIIDTLTNIVFTRCTYLPFMVWYPQMLSNAFRHFWTSVTLHDVPISTATLLMPSITPYITSTPTVNFSDYQVCVRVVSHCHVSIPWSTIASISKILVLPTGSAHPSQNLATSPLSKNCGDAQTAMKHWVKC